MKRTFILTLSALLLMTECCPDKEEGHKFIEPVSFADIKIEDSFWSPRLQKHKETTIGVCIDHIENHGGFLNNFVEAARPEGGKHQGYPADDSDVYKALEGLAYSLQNIPDAELEAKCDDWIDKIAGAQEEDGYLFTWNSLYGLQNRWTDMDLHEMYCAGHMIEAAVAYYEVTGKDKLLKVVERVADHMIDTFGPGKRDWVPGHEEIELALVKLYRVTGKKEYLDFADWLISERGHGLATWAPEANGYHQDILPVRDVTDISGHAVRAMYLYCGMADVAAYTGDQGYIDALARLWDCVVNKNMYITGGIGIQNHGEGFGEPYYLPNLDAYCETCSSVGMILWNWRLNQFTGDARYTDVLERSLYNAALAGISLEGDTFFYVNPLESLGNHHRQDWYFCACCPSQICRFLPSIGNYIYGLSKDALWVNLFIGNKSDYLNIETEYPWDGKVRMTVGPEGSRKKEIRIRIPDWCDNWTISVNGEGCSPEIEKGYAVLGRKWKTGDTIELEMDLEIKVCAADPRIKDDVGKRAIQRGPVVYCLEEADNPDIDSASFGPQTRFKETYSEDLGGIMRIDSDSLHFIPYYSWDNREAGKMKVWVSYQE